MNSFGWLTSAPRMVLSRCNFQLRNFIINRRLVREFQQAANGAKHFETTAKRHYSVTDVDVFHWVKPGYVKAGYAKESLVVQLDPEEASQFGRNRIDLPSLAQLVFEFWDVEVI